jgi:hypothetical protein
VKERPAKRRLGPLQVAASTLAAAFGVQNSRNRERDFREGRLVTFVIAGLVFTALFALTLYLVVSAVLGNAR